MVLHGYAQRFLTMNVARNFSDISFCMRALSVVHSHGSGRVYIQSEREMALQHYNGYLSFDVASLVTISRENH